MGNSTFYPLVSTGCSLGISGCQHITSIVRLFFLGNKKFGFFFSLLLSAWNVIIRPGAHCYFIVWQLQNRIEILHICCPESLCKILPLRACEAAFPLDPWPQRLWPLSAAASVPCALKGGCGTASCRVPQARLQEKIPGRLRIFPTELGQDIKLESGELG